MADTLEVFDPSSDPGITEVMRLQAEEGLDCSCAWDVFYFRHASQWTQELEWELRGAHLEGKPPTNLATFGL